jgi:hypothetical protein
VKQLRRLANAEPTDQSLQCLSKWVADLGGDVDEIQGPLRLLQDLRSTGVAHLRGSRYATLIALAGWDTTPPDQQFQQLVSDVTAAFQRLADLIEAAYRRS